MRAAATTLTVLGGHGLFAVKDEFHAFMRGDETEPLVEAMRVGAGLVRRQLDQRTTALPCFADRPGKHGVADPAATVSLVDPDRLDLCPEGTPAGQARKE